MNLEKINDSVFFSLLSDDVGAYVSLIDNYGNPITNITNYNVCDENDQKIINFIKEIKEDQFFSGWEDEKNEFYIDDNLEIIDYIKDTSRLVCSDLTPINWVLENNKIVLKISKLDDDFYEGNLLLNGYKKFSIISNNYILCDNSIHYVNLKNDSLYLLSEMILKFNKNDLEKYLTLAHSFSDDIEIEYLDYEVIKKDSVMPVKNILIEKVDKDNSLYLKINLSLSTIDYDFLRHYDINETLIVRDDIKKIEITAIDHSFFDDTIEEIIKKISKRQKNMNMKSNFYFENDFMILQENLAKEFITKDLLQLANSYRIIGTENLKKYNVKAVKPKITGNFSSGIDFLEGQIKIDIEGEEFSIEDVFNSFKTESYIVLSDGTNAIINRKYMDKLKRLFKKNNSTVSKLSFFDLPIIDDLIEDKILLNKFKKIRGFYTGINSIEDYNIIPSVITATLRNYQKYGFKWLKYLLDNNFGACLADDMGLGKTLQTIVLITSLHAKKNKKTLIVMPKSLIYNWENEIHKFSPNLKCGIYYGNSRDIKLFDQTDVIITTYGTIRNDISFLTNIDFDLVVLDESQNIKNINAQTTKAVMLLNSKYRIALSGTPIENNLSELYSLFRFLNPNMFGSIEDFNYNYGNPIQKENDKNALEELKKKIYPFILRRVKKDVLKDLPEKIEKTLFIEMNSKQKKIYEDRRLYYYNLIHNQLKSQGLVKTRFYILQALNELRQLTSCPELKDSNLISSKREVLINHVSDSVENGHKVLIFTNYIKSVESITYDLKKKGITYLEMSGFTKERQMLVDKFQKNSKYKVFVMTLKTGGIGLNLTAADKIFIYDPWWNKTVENQAVDRAYRLGQDRTVFSYKLILKDTIEEKILKLQESKSQLLDNLISDEGTSLKSLSEEDIEFILGE